MAVDKGKVKAALDAKFKGKSVSRELKEAYAARWAERIESEEGIEEFINDREEDVLDAAKEADRRATAASNAAKKEAADAITGKTNDKEKEDDDALPADTPDWAKAIIQQNKALTDRIAGFEQKQQTQTIAERFTKDERLKGIPPELLHGRFPTNEADFEAAVESTVTILKPFVEKLAVADFGNDTPPAGQTTGGRGEKEASKESLDAVMNQIPIKI